MDETINNLHDRISETMDSNDAKELALRFTRAELIVMLAALELAGEM